MFIIRFVTSHSKKRFVAQWRHTGTLNAQIEEAFTGHALVKVFGRQHEVEERFRDKNEELYDSQLRGAVHLRHHPAGDDVPRQPQLRRHRGDRWPSGLVGHVEPRRRAGIHPVLAAVHPADDPAGVDGQRAAVRGCLGRARLRIARRRRAEPGPSRAGCRRATHTGRVEFEHVAFSYDPKNPLITDLSFVAEPGQTVAIVGPTGAGKTTLVNLIMRFYEIDGGRITLDGINIADMTRHDLRANVGMVLQDTWLFSGTIRENIVYGNLDCTEEQFHEAVRATYVDRFVHSLPDGYDTLIDDEGGTVSAGEKQLLTIARAFLADPAILILDEATSSVDTRTEVLIQKAMAALRSQRTSFVIAHRLSTIRDADLILVMRLWQHRRAGHPRGAAAAAGRVLRPLQRPVRSAGRRGPLAVRGLVGYDHAVVGRSCSSPSTSRSTRSLKKQRWFSIVGTCGIGVRYTQATFSTTSVPGTETEK